MDAALRWEQCEKIRHYCPVRLQTPLHYMWFMSQTWRACVWHHVFEWGQLCLSVHLSFFLQQSLFLRAEDKDYMKTKPFSKGCDWTQMLLLIHTHHFNDHLIKLLVGSRGCYNSACKGWSMLCHCVTLSLLFFGGVCVVLCTSFTVAGTCYCLQLLHLT